jgi:tetratricopeptide (TPR) repeat protein
LPPRLEFIVSDQIVNPEPKPAAARPRRWLILALVPLLACLAVALGVGSAYRQYDAWRHHRAARAALERGDLEQARADLAVCLAVWPNDVEDQFLAARTARRLERFDEAEEHLRRCQELGWKHDDIALEKRLMRVQRGELSPREDSQLLARAEGGNPDAVVILEALASGYMQSSMQPVDALAILNRLLAIDPNNMRGLLWRGEIHERTLVLDEAINDYKAVLALDENHFEARTKLAWALLHTGLHDQALSNFERLQHQRPGDPRVVLGLALCQRESGQPKEAAGLLDGLLAEHPDNAEALRERGQLALLAREPERAEHWLRQSLRLDPSDPATNHLLARSLSELTRKATRGFLPTAPCLSLHGWLRQLEARGYQAVYEILIADEKRLGELYPELVKHGSHHPEPYCEVANIFLRMRQPIEAREWFQQALRVDPDYRPAREALKRLDRGRGRP